jgi:hypothetical protein
MFRTRHAGDDAEIETLRPTVESDASLRDEPDPDPAVEEALQRLRSQVSEFVAYDEWGRPLAWRHVVRIVLGPLISDLRDSQTAARLGVALTETEPVPTPPTEAPASVVLPAEPIGIGWPG